MSRRGLLAGAAGATVLGAAGVVELVAHGVLPGSRYLNEIDGACSVAPAPESFTTPGPALTGAFYSRARNRRVGYTLAYPPGHGPGSRLPLVIYLYGNGGDHRTPLGGYPLDQALAGHTSAGALAPVALVAADGGSLYWNRHPGDDPMAMLTDELIPLCREHGLGTAQHGIGVIGISMGGYGALLLTEKHPGLISATAAISPAVWRSYDEARAANPHAFASRADFTADDIITHANALAGIPVRIASGASDPFHPGVLALGQRLPDSATLRIRAGCHDNGFFSEQQLPSLRFLAEHLT